VSEWVVPPAANSSPFAWCVELASERASEPEPCLSLKLSHPFVFRFRPFSPPSNLLALRSFYATSQSHLTLRGIFFILFGIP
jgi:hypothetical protein